jgi:hypothetical protein
MGRLARLERLHQNPAEMHDMAAQIHAEILAVKSGWRR